MTVRRAGCVLAGVAGVVAVAACSSSSLAPGNSIAGSWSSQPPGGAFTPGPEADFVLSESGDSVTGTFDAQPEPGTSSVAGTYKRPNVRLLVTPLSVPAGQNGIPLSVILTGYVKNGREMVIDGTTYYKQ